MMNKILRFMKHHRFVKRIEQAHILLQQRMRKEIKLLMKCKYVKSNQIAIYSTRLIPTAWIMFIFTAILKKHKATKWLTFKY